MRNTFDFTDFINKLGEANDTEHTPDGIERLRRQLVNEINAHAEAAKKWAWQRETVLDYFKHKIEENKGCILELSDEYSCDGDYLAQSIAAGHLNGVTKTVYLIRNLESETYFEVTTYDGSEYLVFQTVHIECVFADKPDRVTPEFLEPRTLSSEETALHPA